MLLNNSPFHLFAHSYGKNRDQAVPFWSTKDAGQSPFTFTIGTGSGTSRSQPLAAARGGLRGCD